MLLKNGSHATSFPIIFIHSIVQIDQDSVACNLARDHSAHFVLTAEALQILIDNHPPDYEKEWEIPITVIDQLIGLSEIYCFLLSSVL